VIAVCGSQALVRLLEYQDVRSVLDIGSGAGSQAKILRDADRAVVTNSLCPPADLVGNYLAFAFTGVKFDAIWASHVLEHQPNVNRFLRKCFSDLRDDGVLAVTVPPPKHEIVGGHLSLWNAGLLLYHLIVAGFDCSKARVSEPYENGPGYDKYNVSVIVRKVKATLPPLVFDGGDIEALAEFFPLPVTHGFDGRLPPINW
jgi:SAM-dependent methyltransferase